jgi:hypothetical protein
MRQNWYAEHTSPSCLSESTFIQRKGQINATLTHTYMQNTCRCFISILVALEKQAVEEQGLF